MIPVNRADELVADIGRIRDSMAPAVPAEMPRGGLDVVKNASFNIWADDFHGNVVLSIRDPRFGWLHYAASRESASALAKAIKEQAEKPPESTSRAN